jgi:hypothetical protein
MDLKTGIPDTNMTRTVIDTINPIGNTNQGIGQARTTGYTRVVIRCLGDLNIPCRQITLVESPNIRSGKW